MTRVMTGRGVCIVGAALVALSMPGAALAGGPTNRDQGNAPFDAGSSASLSASSAAVAVSVQAIATLLSAPMTPALAAALQVLTEALESAGPGSAEVAQAFSQALAIIVTPKVAANPPALNAGQTLRALRVLNNITEELSDQVAAVPPTMATLSATLQAQL